MKKLYEYYIASFKGLSAEVWWLALITLINRAGTMVIPFLSLYLSEAMSFTMAEIGWIMSAFGLGSLLGSWLGGLLTDRLGYYKVMYTSLLLSGVGFIAFQMLHQLYTIALGIFVVTTIADTFRPSVFVALTAYSKEENRTRSVSLIRLAINLGFSAGPALGGLIILQLGYGGLFWVDGVTCILAGLLLLKILHPKKAKEQQAVNSENNASPYKDRTYLWFLVAVAIFGLVFLQYFSTVPLYYRDQHGLDEGRIGILLGLNGLLIFLLEMPLIKFLESRGWSASTNMIIGMVLTIFSFAVLNLSSWQGVLVIGIFLVSFGEMIAFPFSNALALRMANKGKQGAYMALYTIAFSLGHLTGHNTGMQLAYRTGFANTWYIMCGLVLIGILVLVSIKKRLSPYQN